MATRRTTIQLPKTEVDTIEMPDGWRMVAGQPTPPSDETEDLEDEPEMSPADRVAEMLRHGNGEDRAVVKLYRISANKGEEFCSEYQPEEFEKIGLDGVREQWGHGQFAVRLYGTAPGSKKFARRASIIINIAEIKTSALAPQQNNDLARVFESIQKNQEMMLKALTEKPAPVDPMANMMQMMQMMTMMREAMGMNAQPQQKSSISELVDAMREMKAAKSLFEGGDDEDKDSLTAMLPQVLDVIKTGMNRQPEPIPPNTPFPPVYIPDSIKSSPVQQPETTGENEMINPLVIARLMKDKAVIEKAIAEKAASIDVANWIVDKASNELVQVLTDEQWFETLKAVVPDCVTHEVWLKETREHVIKMLRDDGYFGDSLDDDDTPPSPPSSEVAVA